MTTKHVEIPVAVEITIRRPDGTVETVRPAGMTQLNDKLFARVKAATAAAGKGQCLSYRNITKATTWEMSAADKVTESSDRMEKMMKYGE